jgi:PKHD-type hydroxylase
MILKNFYYYFQSALSPKICSDILEYGKKHQSQLAITGIKTDIETDKITRNNLKKDSKNIQKKRKSEVVWLNDRWIYNEIHPYIHEANKLAGWNFDWDWSEDCQFTKYGVGQYYGWHNDSGSEPYNCSQNADGTWPGMHGKIRKLSVTVSLCEPTEYVGGNLEFDFKNSMDTEYKKNKTTKECVEIRPRGSIVVFPSFVWHRVTPVTKGTRYSLVMWNLGYPFR